MLRFKIKELIGKRSLVRAAESQLMNQRIQLELIIRDCTVTDNLDKLCTYFECKIEELVELFQMTN